MRKVKVFAALLLAFCLCAAMRPGMKAQAYGLYTGPSSYNYDGRRTNADELIGFDGRFMTNWGDNDKYFAGFYNFLCSIEWATDFYNANARRYDFELDGLGMRFPSFAITNGATVFSYLDAMPKEYRQAYLAIILASYEKGSVEKNIEYFKSIGVWDEFGLDNYWKDDYALKMPSVSDLKGVEIAKDLGDNVFYPVDPNTNYLLGLGGYKAGNIVVPKTMADILNYFNATNDIFSLMTGYTPSTVTYLGEKLYKRYNCYYDVENNLYIKVKDDKSTTVLCVYPSRGIYQFLKEVPFENDDFSTFGSLAPGALGYGVLDFVDTIQNFAIGADENG